MQVKIIPKNDPNADGEWVEVPVELGIGGYQWHYVEHLVKKHIPDTHVMVSYSRLIR